MDYLGPVTTTPRAASGRARRPRVDRRQAIVDAAVELARETPFDEVAVADVARRAGVSHGLLFYYFEDKWAVMAEALTQIVEALHAHQAPRPAETGRRERVEAFARRHVEFLQDRAENYLALVHGGALAQPQLREIVDLARRAGVEMVADLLDLPRPLAPLADLVLTSWVATLDVCTEQVLTRDDLGLDEVVAWAADRLLDDVARLTSD